MFDVVIHAFALMYQARSVPCVMHTDRLRGVFESIITFNIYIPNMHFGVSVS